MILGSLAEPEPEPYRRLDYSRPTQSYEPNYKPQQSNSYSKPGYIKFPSALDFKPSGLKSDYDYEPSYDYSCNPRAPPKCAKYTNATYCLDDYDYPEHDIKVIRHRINYSWL